MTLEDAEAQVLRWLAVTPGAKAAIGSEHQREMIVLVYRFAELQGFRRGYEAGHEAAKEAVDTLQRVREVIE